MLLGDVVCALAAAYALAAMAATVRWLWKPRRESAGRRPPVTVLKPVCGAEPGLYASLRSCCDQDYPEFQIVFGVHRLDDPAVAIVERLKEEFPALPLTLVVDETLIGANYKVSNLANMLPAARHDVLVIADSDIRVGRDYLARVVAPLAQPGVGAATCLYRARGERGVYSRLAAMFVNGWFVPSVLVSAAFGWRAFGFGATFAIRRTVLDEAGGFAAIANHIADDYMLGYGVRRAGYRTVLSSYLVETSVPDHGPLSLLRHELRQARALRLLQPVGYAFTFITFGIPLCAAMLALTGPQPFALAALALTLAAKLVLHAMVSPRGNSSLLDPWLVPARDVLSLLIWLWSYASRRIYWRAHHFTMRRDGTLCEKPLDARRPNYAAAWFRVRNAVFSRFAIPFGQRK